MARLVPILSLALAACAATVPAPTVPVDPDFACETSDDCAVIPVHCGHCGAPSFADHVAVARAAVPDEGFWAARGEPEGLFVCPRCRGASDWRLLPRCDGGRCEAIDLRGDREIRGCETDADCSLRHASCGPPDESAPYVAIGRGGHAAYERVFCPTGASAAARESPGFPVACREGLCQLGIDEPDASLP